MRVKVKGKELNKKKEEHSWLIQKQGCGLDPALRHHAFSVFVGALLVVVTAIVDCQSAAGCVF